MLAHLSMQIINIENSIQVIPEKNDVKIVTNDLQDTFNKEQINHAFTIKIG